MTIEEQNQQPINNPMLQEKEEEEQQQIERKLFDPGSDEPGTPLPLTVTSRVLYMLGDLTSGSAFRFSQWLELVRKRTAQYRSSGFPHRPPRLYLDMPLSAGESDFDPECSTASEKPTEVNLWQRLGKAAMVDIESSSFCRDSLSSLHHTEHSGSAEQSDYICSAEQSGGYQNVHYIYVIFRLHSQFG